jgi:hypothetical protein
MPISDPALTPLLDELITAADKLIDLETMLTILHHRSRESREAKHKIEQQILAIAGGRIASGSVFIHADRWLVEVLSPEEDQLFRVTKLVKVTQLIKAESIQ